MMGVPFVGGYHLAIWRFSRKVSAALKLVEFLAGRQAPQTLYPAFGLPARLEILEQAPALQAPPVQRLRADAEAWPIISGGPHVGPDRKASGRCAPGDLGRRAGVADDPDLTAILDRHIAPLANRLRLTLKA